MSLFDNLNRFLEEKLDEFLRNNPELEIKAILEQIKEQERDTLKQIINLEAQQKQLEQQILTVAKDIQLWDSRVKKAQSAGETELAEKAAEREASLLHQGNLLWGKMQSIKEQITQARQLLKQIEAKRRETEQKIATNFQTKTTSTDSATKGWNQTYSNKYNDPLEQVFQEWETNQELEQIKRNLGL